MAGDAEDGRMYVLLLFITVFMPVGFHLTEEPISTKAAIAYN